MADTDGNGGGGRMWSACVLLELARIWKRVELAHPALGRVPKAQLVYDAFIQERSEHGSVKRSRKAVEDKLYAMKQMHRFITEMNRSAERNAASRSDSSSNIDSHTQPWFALSPAQQRNLRSLHGVHIPSISKEVFLVLDSVLMQRDAKRSAKSREQVDASSERAASQSTPASSQATARAAAGTSTAASAEATLTESKRNWSAEATAELASAWSDIQRAHPHLRGAPLCDQVYRALEQRANGPLARSHKAVAEKMQSMKEMYQCIQSYDASVLATTDLSSGDRVARMWFDLTNAERRHIRKTRNTRAANLSREQFEHMEAIMSARAGAEAPAAAAGSESVGRAEQRQATESLAARSAPDMRETLEQIAAQALRTRAPASQSYCHCDVSSVRTPSPSSAAATATATAGAASVRDRMRKRARLETSTAFQAPPIDPASASALLDEIRALHEADRAERQRQHAELLGALRELMALIRSSSR